MSHVELKAYVRTNFTTWNCISVQSNVPFPNLEIHESDETAQQAQPGSNNDDIMEDPDAGPNIEQLGGIIFQQTMHDDGQVDLLVLVIDACAETPDVL